VVKSDLLLFDLDGTLVDTADDIADSLLAVLAEFDRPPLPRDQIVASIGHGVRRLIEQTTAPPHDEILRRFLKHYDGNCLHRTRLYPEVPETLGQLQHRKVVLTNKPAAMSVKILRELGISRFFEKIYGGDSLPVRKPDPEVIRLVTTELGASTPILIGDSGVDVVTARNAGIPVIAVTYGYCKPGDLDGADARIDRFESLLQILR